jgi:pimeloyl-ACP methyl ester carboxylesterase
VPYFSSDGVRIRYELAGPISGRPTLLIHGFASNYRANWVDTGWERELLRARRLVIGFDLRGHGLSDKPHSPSLYAESVMAQDAMNLLDYVDVRQADVIGYSLGARFAFRLSSVAPSRIKHAVLGGLPSRNPEQGDAIARHLLGDMEVDEPIAFFFGRFAAAIPGNDLQALAACMRGEWYPLTDLELNDITVPLLIAAGTEDVLASGAETLAGNVPGSQFRWLPGRNHVNAVPDRGFKQLTLDFLEGHKPGR